MLFKHKALLVFALMGLACILIYIFYGLTPDNWDYNFPRRIKIMLAVLVVSLAIGSSSLVFQTITANHILTPSIMGLDSLYLFLLTFVVFAFGSGELVLMSDLPSFLLSMTLMTGLSMGLFALLFRGQDDNVYFLVLAGLIFGTVFSGLSTFMQVLIDPNEFAVLEGKLFASFNRINVDLLWVAVGIVTVCMVLWVRDFKYLDVLTLGRSHAINLGVNYSMLVLRSWAYIALMTATATVLVGPITFLGILVISLARMVFKSFRHKVLALGSFLVCVFILSFGMLVTERFFSFKTPLSVIINFVGGIYFIYLLLRMKRI